LGYETASKEVPAGINAAKEGAVWNVIERGGATAAEFDGFGSDIWYEIKVNLNNESVGDLTAQLTREVQVAQSYGKQVSIVTSVSMSTIGSNKIELCQKLGVKIISLN